MSGWASSGTQRSEIESIAASPVSPTPSPPIKSAAATAAPPLRLIRATTKR